MEQSNLILILVFVKLPYVILPYIDDYRNSLLVYQRLVDMMSSYYKTGQRRIEDLDEIKWAQENSTHFEEGYVIGEIIDRYKKMVSHVKTTQKYKSNTVYETLRYTDYIQRLYMEIYHLVNMYHEIPHKYAMHPCMLGQIDQGGADPFLMEAKSTLKAEVKARERDKKKHMSMYKKMRETFMKGNSMNFSFIHEKKNKSAMWPLEYGWEIDYYW